MLVKENNLKLGSASGKGFSITKRAQVRILYFLRIYLRWLSATQVSSSGQDLRVKSSEKQERPLQKALDLGATKTGKVEEGVDKTLEGRGETRLKEPLVGA